ncbi:hypothetical protein PGT21_020408 [Puccinia graminis f. sp. tritici]|uniref:Uncharacterized protein n=1 Tax=Puccinia graminis f. sp. tritici TaxID=56615 RepID=A0A5B0LZ06_PUCGR|nr:hypothetical protein PGT21_020408 [Puccinia graminis f. sp. tritici]
MQAFHQSLSNENPRAEGQPLAPGSAPCGGRNAIGFPGEFGGGARRLPGKVTPLRLRRLQSGLDASPDSLLWAALACEWHVRQRPCGAALRALKYSEACVRLGFSGSPGNASPFRANPGPVGLGIKGGEQSVILIRHPEWKPLFGKLDESQSIPYNMGEGGGRLAHIEACELQASKLPGISAPTSQVTRQVIHFTSVQTRTENTSSLRGGVMCSIPSSPIRPSAARALLDIMQTFGTGFIAEVPAGVFRPLY